MKITKDNNFNILIERVTPNKNNEFIPDDDEVRKWVSFTLTNENKLGSTELGIRLTDDTEVHSLNKTYRHKDKSTNVLSFPFEIPENIPEIIENNYLGDIVCSCEYINKEAKKHNKALVSHWAHIIIHGTLHLLGYDHIDNDEAEIMENKEIEILKSLGFENPYSS